ncbi:MAG: hypothetical protein IPJ00_17120 [Saprospirales bacterium]|nr:hypothetical protein [Saprospirales bacterium]
MEAGDLLQVNEGDQIPADGTVEEGEALLDESMLTGESEPRGKSRGEAVIGASLVVQGALKVRATAVGRQTVLEQDDRAGQDRPAGNLYPTAGRPGERHLVPVVVGIAMLTFLLSYFAFDIAFQKPL